jgi:hypothetical protein
MTAANPGLPVPVSTRDENFRIVNRWENTNMGIRRHGRSQRAPQVRRLMAVDLAGQQFA